MGFRQPPSPLGEKINYPTFPNPAGIGNGRGYEPQLVGGSPPPDPIQGQTMIPTQPHPPMRFIPRPWMADPVQAVDSPYNPYPASYSPWLDSRRDGR